MGKGLILLTKQFIWGFREILRVGQILRENNHRKENSLLLSGCGFPWGSGLKAAQNGNVWFMPVIPRLLYGLDIQLFKKKDIENIEKFQRQCLKQIQGLPDNTSNSACLAILGILLIETILQLHKNLLSMYVNMTRNGDSIEYEITQRQLVIKELHQKSLFNFINKDILELYELPSIFHLLNTPPSKEEWKGMLNHKIHEKVESL